MSTPYRVSTVLLALTMLLALSVQANAQCCGQQAYPAQVVYPQQVYPSQVVYPQQVFYPQAQQLNVVPMNVQSFSQTQTRLLAAPSVMATGSCYTTCLARHPGQQDYCAQCCADGSCITGAINMAPMALAPAGSCYTTCLARHPGQQDYCAQCCADGSCITGAMNMAPMNMAPMNMAPMGFAPAGSCYTTCLARHPGQQDYCAQCCADGSCITGAVMPLAPGAIIIGQ